LDDLYARGDAPWVVWKPAPLQGHELLREVNESDSEVSPDLAASRPDA
jgi:hypothetical protein